MVRLLRTGRSHAMSSSAPLASDPAAPPTWISRTATTADPATTALLRFHTRGRRNVTLFYTPRIQRNALTWANSSIRLSARLITGRFAVQIRVGPSQIRSVSCRPGIGASSPLLSNFRVITVLRRRVLRVSSIQNLPDSYQVRDSRLPRVALQDPRAADSVRACQSCAACGSRDSVEVSVNPGRSRERLCIGTATPANAPWRYLRRGGAYLPPPLAQSTLCVREGSHHASVHPIRDARRGPQWADA